MNILCYFIIHKIEDLPIETKHMHEMPTTAIDNPVAWAFRFTYSTSNNSQISQFKCKSC